MRLLATLAALAALSLGCPGSRADNRRAKARVFAAHPEEPTPPWRLPLDLEALPREPAVQDRALGMGEVEAAHRLGTFELLGTLELSYSGPGQSLAVVEDRLVEEGAENGLRLRLLMSTGTGLELIQTGGKLYGRSRYGPFVEREPSEEFDRQRDEVFGALGALYRESDRAWLLAPRDLATVAGRPCQRFDIAVGSPRPEPRPARFTGRLDPDSERHFAFLFGRELGEVHGTVCLDRETGVPLSAKVSVHWTARGDGGEAQITAKLTEALDRIGRPLAIAAPASPLPRPHRPRGPAAILARFGFGPALDGGTAGPPPTQRPKS